MKTVPFPVRCYCLALLLPVALLAVGCQKSGPDQVISGKVSFQGKPVTIGDVTFINPGTGSVAQGSLGEEGNYTLLLINNGLKPGKYKVTVSPKITYEKGKSREGSDFKMVESGGKSIPERYHYDASTRLSATITGGQESFDFELKN